MCLQSPMLRSYNRLFVPGSSRETIVGCVKTNLTFLQRKKCTQLRLGCLGLRIHTDRFLAIKNTPAERLCVHCSMQATEDEIHFLCSCPRYNEIRNKLYLKVEDPSFQTLNTENKYIYLLTLRSLTRHVANYLIDEKFGWPTATLFLAPVEGWKGPSGPAENLWPHLK